ncbi:hypothetical protein RCL_jg13785.t1 [Rhizophagus clarus]|uniref:Uncharacterized protein n=1 Tax=Rhizophagus clarus TaxID=94130 RepID=A0A8H3MB51_9GLOM|nr:hypothetical protein RCL_jg13785.t1 [Rhizophagus clarus]
MLASARINRNNFTYQIQHSTASCNDAYSWPTSNNKRRIIKTQSSNLILTNNFDFVIRNGIARLSLFTTEFPGVAITVVNAGWYLICLAREPEVVWDKISFLSVEIILEISNNFTLELSL